MDWKHMEAWQRDELVHRHILHKKSQRIPGYTTNMNMAWRVIRELERQEYDELHSSFAYYLGVRYATDDGFDTFSINLEQLAELTPEKICHAALKTLHVI